MNVRFVLHKYSGTRLRFMTKWCTNTRPASDQSNMQTTWIATARRVRIVNHAPLVSAAPLARLHARAHMSGWVSEWVDGPLEWQATPRINSSARSSRVCVTWVCRLGAVSRSKGSRRTHWCGRAVRSVISVGVGWGEGSDPFCVRGGRRCHLPVPPVVRQPVRVAAPYVAVGRHFRPRCPGLVLLDRALRVLRERVLGGRVAVEPVPQHDGIALAVAGVMVLWLAATNHVLPTQTSIAVVNPFVEACLVFSFIVYFGYVCMCCNVATSLNYAKFEHTRLVINQDTPTL